MRCAVSNKFLRLRGLLLQLVRVFYDFWKLQYGLGQCKLSNSKKKSLNELPILPCFGISNTKLFTWCLFFFCSIYSLGGIPRSSDLWPIGAYYCSTIQTKESFRTSPVSRIPLVIWILLYDCKFWFGFIAFVTHISIGQGIVSWNFYNDKWYNVHILILIHYICSAQFHWLSHCWWKFSKWSDDLLALKKNNLNNNRRNTWFRLML